MVIVATVAIVERSALAKIQPGSLINVPSFTARCSILLTFHTDKPKKNIPKYPHTKYFFCVFFYIQNNNRQTVHMKCVYYALRSIFEFYSIHFLFLCVCVCSVFFFFLFIFVFFIFLFIVYHRYRTIRHKIIINHLIISNNFDPF